MKHLLLAFGCLFLVSCIHSVERAPSQIVVDPEIHSYGNFFQKVRIKSTQQRVHTSKFEKILGRKIQVDYNTLDLPYIDPISKIQKKDNWSIEQPSLNVDPDSRYTNYILDMNFGQISESQFSELKKAMGSSNQLGWLPEKEYSIVDFMPISVQALYGNYYTHNQFTYDKKVLPWHYKFKEVTSEGTISRISNCWHAAWEYLQGASDKATIFFASEQSVRAIFEDNKNSRIIKKFKSEKIAELYSSPESFFKGIAPGDLILIYQTMQSMAQGEFETLAHVAIAIAIDNNLVFEKMNPISQLPYRLAFLTDSIDNLI